MMKLWDSLTDEGKAVVGAIVLIVEAWLLFG